MTPPNGRGTTTTKDLRIPAGIGHGQQERLVVLQREVLIGKLRSVDGFAASTLRRILVRRFLLLERERKTTHIVPLKVASLEHEIRNDAVEGRALIVKLGVFLARAELPEVLRRPWGYVVVQLKVDPASLLCHGPGGGPSANDTPSPSLRERERAHSPSIVSSSLGPVHLTTM